MDDKKDTHRELTDEFRKVHHRMPLWVLLLILLAVVIVLAYHTIDLVVILLLSGVLAYMLSSVINKIQSLGLKRNIAVILLCSLPCSVSLSGPSCCSPLICARKSGISMRGSLNFPNRSRAALKQQSADTAKDYTLMEQVIRKILSEAMMPGRLINKTLDISAGFRLCCAVRSRSDAYPLFRILPAQGLA